MALTLTEVLAKARAESVDKEPMPVVVEAIKRLEELDLLETQKLFQPQPASLPETRKRLVAVGGHTQGQDYLNANGIK
jgi:hypothetical protein